MGGVCCVVCFRSCGGSESSSLCLVQQQWNPIDAMAGRWLAPLSAPTLLLKTQRLKSAMSIVTPLTARPSANVRIHIHIYYPPLFTRFTYYIHTYILPTLIYSF